MKRLSSRLSSLCGRLAVLVLAVSAMASNAGEVNSFILFRASFDHLAYSDIITGPLPADVGMFEVEASPSMFKQVVDDGGNGVLVIISRDREADGELVAEFERRYVGSELRIKAQILPVTTKALMSVRAEDDDVGVMLDIGWKEGLFLIGSTEQDNNTGAPTTTGSGGGGGGTVTTTGGGGGGSGGGGSGGGGGGGSGPNAGTPSNPGEPDPKGFAYEEGVNYHMDVLVRATHGGVATYNVTLTWDGGSYTDAGELRHEGLLDVSKLRFVRPGNGKLGAFIIDNVSVSTTGINTAP